MHWLSFFAGVAGAHAVSACAVVAIWLVRLRAAEGMTEVRAEFERQAVRREVMVLMRDPPMFRASERNSPLCSDCGTLLEHAPGPETRH